MQEKWRTQRIICTTFNLSQTKKFCTKQALSLTSDPVWISNSTSLFDVKIQYYNYSYNSNDDDNDNNKDDDIGNNDSDNKAVLGLYHVTTYTQ